MNNVIVIPLHENFLRRAAAEIVARHVSPIDPLELARVTIVLPHRRGIVYMREYISQLMGTRQQRPFLIPRIIAIEDLVKELALYREDPPQRAISPPDQAWLLFEVVQGHAPYGQVADSWDRFFPWGIRLAALLDEIDRELLVPQDLQYPDDVSHDARTLLEGLQKIYTDFDRLLTQRSLTTPAKRLRLLAQQVAEASWGGGPIYLIGFYALTGAEERIFKYLFSQGARIFWHADPEALPPLYRRWKERWGLTIETLGGKGMAPSPPIHFYEAYDLHAELLQVQGIIPPAIERPDQCAIVLPDPSALIPTLYSLPHEMPVNVSLGYPLERTAFASLVEQLMRLQESRDEIGGYYYRDYLAFIRHPFVRRLPTVRGGEGRIVLHFLEEKIRHHGKPFLSDDTLGAVLAMGDDPKRDARFLAAEGLDVSEAQKFVQELHRRLVMPWENLHTPSTLAACLKGLVRIIIAPFVEDEQSLRDHPFEHEFIYTVLQTVIPTLEDALFAEHPMDTRLLFSLLREIMHTARTPFEGHPLLGLQVLGLLETRLLSFDRVIVIDVNEDVLPAHEEVNPLLPESLKTALGLAGREREEAIVRYHVERLITGSKEAHLLWQSCTLPSASGIEGKRVRSRFVESFLWQEEKKQGILLPDCVVKAPLNITADAFRKEKGLVKGAREQRQVRDFISAWSTSHGLSASFLNTYLLCPLKFYYHYLLGLKPIIAISEEVDAAAVGEIVHQSLEEYFSPYLNHVYRKAAENDPEQLIAIFRRRFQESVMYQGLAPEKRFFLEYAARYRLTRYLAQLPDSTFIEAVEEEHRLTLFLNHRDYTFSGKVDRIDRREAYRIILDYKTGTVDLLSKGHFTQKVLPFIIPDKLDFDGLKAFREAIRDLQLPLYITLVAAGKEKELGRVLAAYVELGREGEERYFIPPERFAGIRDAAISWFSRTFPSLLTYLIEHMITAPYFFPTTNEEACRFCDYESVCRFSFTS
jgi:ATP-dependent helicase/nuclease subunit B